MPKKVVLITGSSRGIGLHLSRRFLKEGYRVVGISRTKSPINDVNFSELIVDLGDRESLSKIADQLSDEPIIGLINNAGIHGPIGAFESISLEKWEETFNVNLFSSAYLAQFSIPALRRHNGFIIFVSGGGSAFPRANFSAYGVSKCGVIRLADTLALELAPEIMVYCIAPGPNRTGLLEEALSHGDQTSKEDMVDFTLPEELCLFLARNRDPRYSGKFIHVKDDYQAWGQAQLEEVPYTLRRIDPRTLSRVSIF